MSQCVLDVANIIQGKLRTQMLTQLFGEMLHYFAFVGLCWSFNAT